MHVACLPIRRDEVIWICILTTHVCIPTSISCCFNCDLIVFCPCWAHLVLLESTSRQTATSTRQVLPMQLVFHELWAWHCLFKYILIFNEFAHISFSLLLTQDGATTKLSLSNFCSLHSIPLQAAGLHSKGGLILAGNLTRIWLSVSIVFPLTPPSSSHSFLPLSCLGSASPSIHASTPSQ